MEIFGFKFGSKADDDKSELKSIAVDPNDGSLVIEKQNNVDVSGGAFGWSTSFDVDSSTISDTQLITQYRKMALDAEIDKAISIIINEMVSTAADEVVTIDLDRLEYSESLKKVIIEEFEHIIKIMGFNESAYEILSRWYIDGRIYYQVVVDKEKCKEEGIGKLTYLDPRKIKKVRVVDKTKDLRTGADLYQEMKSHYVYSNHGLQNSVSSIDTGLNSTIQIAEDAVVQATSGLLDPSNTTILSYLHKAIRPLNQLRGLEDASIIYKIARAPERRIFYIDVGNLPPAKAEAVLQKQMNQYRMKPVYDSSTGAIRSDPKHTTLIEDYWLPRRSNGTATQIDTLPAGNLAGNTSEVEYFLNKLFNSLNVPITRMDSTTGFSFGKTTEITRDEVALTKFIVRLRRRFSAIFLDLLKRQLALKGILNNHEFDNIRHLISFQFESDNHFDEMLKLEVLEQRMNQFDRLINYVPGGQFATFFSKEYIYKEIMMYTDEEIALMKEQIEEEMKALPQDPEMEGDGSEGGPNVSRVLHTADPKKNKAKQPTDNINNTTDSGNAQQAEAPTGETDAG